MSCAEAKCVMDFVLVVLGVIFVVVLYKTDGENRADDC